MSAEWHKVTKEEFGEFLLAYPRKLIRDTTGICDPPLRSWNDFDKAPMWPDSMVAKEILNEFYGTPNDYFIYR